MKKHPAGFMSYVRFDNSHENDNEEKRKDNSLAKVIAARQFLDWRKLRFESFSSPQVGRMIAKMATQIVESLEREHPENQPLSSSAATPKKTSQDNSAE